MEKNSPLELHASSTTFDNSSLSDNSFDQIFIANLSNGEQGLYIRLDLIPYPTHDYELFKVIETSDIFDGQTVGGIELSPDSSEYEHGNIAFTIDFTDGSEGLYDLNIYDAYILPEPACLGLWMVPLLCMLRRQRYANRIASNQNGRMVESLEQRRLLSALTAIGLDAGNSKGVWNLSMSHLLLRLH